MTNSYGTIGIALLILAARPLAIGAETRWTHLEVRNAITNTPVSLNDVAFGNGTFVAVGSLGEIYLSTNAIHWLEGQPLTNVSFTAVTFGHGGFLATGLNTTTSDALVFTSETGAIWTPRRVPTAMPLLRTAYGNGRYVAVNHKELVVSLDGTEWTAYPQSANSPFWAIGGICFAHGLFLLPILHGGSGSTLLRSSTDAITWTEQALNDGAVSGVTFGRGRFIAVSNIDCSPCSGPDYISLDGRAWFIEEVGAWRNPAAVAYANGMFVVAGFSSDDHLSLWTSHDANTWAQFRLPERLRFPRRLAFGVGRFVAVGEGFLAYSDPVVFLPLIMNVRASGNALAFDTDAPEGTRWDVQVSPELTAWTTVGTIEGTSSNHQTFTYTQSSSGKQFFRLVRQP